MTARPTSSGRRMSVEDLPALAGTTLGRPIQLRKPARSVISPPPGAQEIREISDLDRCGLSRGGVAGEKNGRLLGR